MLFGTMKIDNNELHIGGVSVRDLLAKHGSPLYVYDEAHIDYMLDLYKAHFTSSLFTARVVYASKAFLTKAMVRKLMDYHMGIDLVSGGEMYTASSVGYNMSNAIIHGNNKSPFELEACFDYKVGYIVVDNIDEVIDVIEMANQRKQEVKCLLRVNPGVEAHTHEYIVTAKLTSKFGESIFDLATIEKIVALYNDSQYARLEGFHCHIGSQVFDHTSFIKTVDVMTDFVNSVKTQFGFVTNTLNLGGGFGVYYTEGDTAIDVETFTRQIIETVETKVNNKELEIKELIIEPGRSIISNAGVTLYNIGYKKETFGGKNYVFVNGGMSDNIRPALYKAEYECDIATNMNGVRSGSWTVAGKLCESGDLLISNTSLQDFQKGDVLAIYTTGAYNYSMASNYNRILKPAVVFVKDGETKEVVKRETFEDLIRNDI